MLSLVVAAVLGQCSNARSYGYTYSYGTPYISYGPAYQQTAYQAPAYQAPKYNYDYSAIVGQYLREETAAREQAEQKAKLDRLALLVEQMAAQPAPQPQPAFQAPPPPAKVQPTPQYSLPSPQVPEKAPPVFQTPSYQAAPQAPYPGDAVPPPPVVPQKAPPSFGAPYGVQPQSYGGSVNGVAALTSILTNRCAQCHTADATSGGGYKFLESAGVLAARDVAENADTIMNDLVSGRMPKGGPRLSYDEIMAVYQGLQQLAGQPQPSAGLQASNRVGFGY